MKRIKLVMIQGLVASIILCVLFSNRVLLAGDKQEQTTAEQQRMMELWKKYSFPGPHHKHLEYFVGDWDSIQKIFPSAGGEPVTQTQEIHVESLFGGRFTRAHIKVNANIMGIIPEGFVITGYDNYQDKVISVTYGNYATDFTFLSGTLSKDGKTRIDTGTLPNVFTGKEYRVKAVTTIINHDKYLYEYYKIDAAGKESKGMEITYTRKH